MSSHKIRNKDKEEPKPESYKSSSTPAEENIPLPTAQEGAPPSLQTDPLEIIKKKENELKELNEKYLRLLAEFENYKKRAAREQLDYMKYAYEPVIKEILPILDNLERALFHSHGSKDITKLNEGLGLIIKKSQETLSQLGVTPILAKGKVFDPAIHQAISQVETDEVDENHVVEEITKGYLFKDRVLRPAMVTVSKKKTSETAKEPT